MVKASDALLCLYYIDILANKIYSNPNYLEGAIIFTVCFRFKAILLNTRTKKLY